MKRVERLEATDGRVRVSVLAGGDHDLRPDIFELAKRHGWTLYDLHQETGSLEDLFRQLTTADGTAGDPTPAA